MPGFARLQRASALLAAWAHSAAGQAQEAGGQFEAARQVLEREGQEHPNDPRYHGSLGITYAALGQREAAVREGQTAVALLPVSRDAVYGMPALIDMAVIHAMIGDQEVALNEIENLLTVPSWISPKWLEIDPRFDRLNENPRFQAMLASHAQ